MTCPSVMMRMRLFKCRKLRKWEMWKWQLPLFLKWLIISSEIYVPLPNEIGFAVITKAIFTHVSVSV